MKAVERNEIIDYVTYQAQRDSFRAEVMKVKAPRRVHIGDHLTLLFENHSTVRYQIQEMIRAERIVRESDIVHELNTYNELLGKDGELGCTLLIEIDDPALRDEKLQEWWELPDRIFLELSDGERIRATFDERQRGEHRLSSVQYLKFDTRGEVPIAVAVDLPGFGTPTRLTDEQREALRHDLQSAA
jgi:hypothetical protein